jgi:Protein of unknown function (DUF4232)
MIALPVSAVPLGGPLPCHARDVRSFNGMLTGATGTMDGAVYLRNVSGARCAVGGRPGVEVVTRSGTALRTTERTFALRQAGGRPLSVLPPRGRAVLHLDWSNWCGAWPTPSTHLRHLYLRVTTTAGPRLLLPIRTGRPRCDQPTAPSILYVSPFATVV